MSRSGTHSDQPDHVLTIRLDPGDYQRLAALARAAGQRPIEWVQEWLEQFLAIERRHQGCEVRDRPLSHKGGR